MEHGLNSSNHALAEVGRFHFLFPYAREIFVENIFHVRCFRQRALIAEAMLS